MHLKIKVFTTKNSGWHAVVSLASALHSRSPGAARGFAREYSLDSDARVRLATVRPAHDLALVDSELSSLAIRFAEADNTLKPFSLLALRFSTGQEPLVAERRDVRARFSGVVRTTQGKKYLSTG